MWRNRKPSSSGKIESAGLDELLPRQRHQARCGRSPLLLRRELGDGAAPELLANDCGAFDHGPLLRLEPVEAGGEKSVDRRRNREVVRGRAVLGQHREHLLDVERVALRGLCDPREEVGRELRLPAQELEQRLGFRLGQRIEHDRRRTRGGSEPAGVLLEQIRASHADDQDRRVADPAEQVLDQVEEGRLRPLQVVERDHERHVAREALEQPADRPHRLLRGARCCRRFRSRPRPWPRPCSRRARPREASRSLRGKPRRLPAGRGLGAAST